MPILTPEDVDTMIENLKKELNDKFDEIDSRYSNFDATKFAREAEKTKIENSLKFKDSEIESLKLRIAEYEQRERESQMSSADRVLDAAHKIYDKTPITSDSIVVESEYSRKAKEFYS